MSNHRNLAPLVLGLILVLIGGTFLAINVVGLDVSWWHLIKFGIPVLLALLGVSKLVRHYTWSEEQLRAEPGKSSLLGGVFWTCVGVVWLLGAMKVISGFDFFGSYWPGVLILFGLGKILDFYRLPSGVQFRAGEVVGVVFFMMLGLTVSWMADLPGVKGDWPAWGDKDWYEIFNPDAARHKVRVESQEQVSAAGVKSLQIENHFGDIEVEKGLNDQVEVSLTAIASGDEDKRAQALARQVQLSVMKEGELVKVGTNRASVNDPAYRLVTHLRVLAPENVALEITDEHGAVKVTAMSAAVSVTNSNGQVSLESIRGPIVVKNEYDQVSLINTEGTVNVENRKGRVYLRDIKGDTTAVTDYDTIDAERLTGKIELADKFGEVRVREVEGSLTVKSPGCEVDVSKISKATLIENSHKSVRVSDLADTLELNTSYCKATLSALQGAAIIRASDAEIGVRGAAKGVNVEATDSRVSLSDVQGAIKIATSMKKVSLEDFKGPVDIQNQYGDIYVQPSAPLGGAIRASNRNGEITLALPKDVSCRLSAQAPGGEILSDFGERNPEKSQTFEQTIGAGENEVRLQTTHAQIRIRKSGGD